MSSIFKVISVAALACGVVSASYAASPISGDFPVVADSDLDQMRGGFETSSNGSSLSFTFGIEKATFLNGQLVSTTTIPIPTLSSALNAQGGGATGSNSITYINSGGGNFFSPPSMAPGSQMTVIQNSLDNQVIGNATVVNASVTSLNFIKSLVVQSSLNQMIFSSFH
jgi:hypothetical protein